MSEVIQTVDSFSMESAFEAWYSAKIIPYLPPMINSSKEDIEKNIKMVAKNAYLAGAIYQAAETKNQ
jgi:hypothetical protein